MQLCRRPLRWYIMTSAATDAATREFFAARAYFGLQADQVVFFPQVNALSVDTRPGGASGPKRPSRAHARTTPEIPKHGWLRCPSAAALPIIRLSKCQIARVDLNSAMRRLCWHVRALGHGRGVPPRFCKQKFLFS